MDSSGDSMIDEKANHVMEVEPMNSKVTLRPRLHAKARTVPVCHG
ncbi:hypothetical protein LEMLEM_LOCUS20342 [Lemmus lemmus]